MASAVNAFDIDAMRNRLSGVTRRARLDILDAEAVDRDQLAVGDDAIDEARRMRGKLPIGEDLVDFGERRLVWGGGWGRGGGGKGKGQQGHGRMQLHQFPLSVWEEG